MRRPVRGDHRRWLVRVLDLYIYVNAGKAAENPALAAFVDLYLSDEGLATVSEAGYVDLPTERIEATRSAWAG